MTQERDLAQGDLRACGVASLGQRLLRRLEVLPGLGQGGFGVLDGVLGGRLPRSALGFPIPGAGFPLVVAGTLFGRRVVAFGAAQRHLRLLDRAAGCRLGLGRGVGLLVADPRRLVAAVGVQGVHGLLGGGAEGFLVVGDLVSEGAQRCLELGDVRAGHRGPQRAVGGQVAGQHEGGASRHVD